MKTVLLILLSSVILSTYAQDTKSVLFLGNSYTYFNDLPTLLENLANANGDILIHDKNTPGGYTLESHSTNITSLNKIASNNWDYVVLQDQSQRPSFPPNQVAVEVKPFAEILIDSIRSNNSCSKPIFFMTWGRKNGDASNCGSYPPICTYLGMQQRLRESYLEMTFENDVDCSPVGIAWKKVRELYPSIELYNPDESHPSLKGSYLAACVFYSSMYNKSTIGNTFWSSLDSLTAYRLQDIASSTVLDSLNVWSIEPLANNFDIIDSIIFDCDSIEITGNWHYTDTSFTDTTTVGSCATITNYSINIGLETIDSIITFCDSIEILGNWYISDTIFTDTLTGNICPLIVNFELEKYEIEIIDTIINTCDSIEIDGNWYTNDTFFTDTSYFPCLTISNYHITVNNSVEIDHFVQIYLLKDEETGFYFQAMVNNYDYITIYNNDTVVFEFTDIYSAPSMYLCKNGIDSIEFILVAENSCSTDSLTRIFYCGSFSSINDLNNSNWSIFPNPTNNFIEILSSDIKEFSISLFDISGKELLTNVSSKKEYMKLDISDFEKGMYLLVLYDKNKIAIGQKNIIKN